MTEPHGVDAGNFSVDPFHERARSAFVAHKRLLGMPFRFESTHAELLVLVEAAYAGLPDYALSADSIECVVELRLVAREKARCGDEPPAPVTQSGAGLFCAIVDESNYAIVAPQWRRALIVASQDRLEHAYELRYELIEFTVFLLAARTQGLVPLHGACVGRDGRGVVLFGARGAGKSTLCLQALRHGMELLAEDAVFVHPQSLLAVGVPNYLHLRTDGLDHVDADWRERIETARVIRRRSGEEKFEIDARTLPGHLAARPLKIVAAAFLSNQRTDSADELFGPISEEEIAQRLREEQPYAAQQDGWRRFTAAMTRLRCGVLRRADTSIETIAALEWLVE